MVTGKCKSHINGRVDTPTFRPNILWSSSLAVDMRCRVLFCLGFLYVTNLNAFCSGTYGVLAVTSYCTLYFRITKSTLHLGPVYSRPQS